MTPAELARTPPLPSDQDASGRALGDEELARLEEVIRSGVLTSTKGAQVPALEAALADRFAGREAVACSSGTAAIHAAIAAIDPEPGDEVVTTPVTDMGALAPILYQGAIPRFADVDPVSGNVTPDTVRAACGDRTRAIVATHLFGHPCELTGLRAVARERGVPLVEDCAQASLARSAGELVGTVGVLACFSLQQGKHITTGEGGFVLAGDPRLARRVRLFVNKAWPYGEDEPDHEFLALNSRMSELQGAVANAQLEKLDDLVRVRRRRARRLTAALAGVPGLTVPAVGEGDEHAYWKYPVIVDPDVVPGGPNALAGALRPAGIPSAPRYIRKPAFRCAVFRDQRTFGSSRYPFTLASRDALDYSEQRFPGTFEFLRRVLVLPWNGRYTDAHVDHIAAALVESVASLRDRSGA